MVQQLSNIYSNVSDILMVWVEPSVLPHTFLEYDPWLVDLAEFTIIYTKVCHDLDLFLPLALMRHLGLDLKILEYLLVVTLPAGPWTLEVSIYQGAVSI